MKKDPKIFLGHIIQSIAEIENHTKGIYKEQFKDDIKTQDAVVRRIEVIGEATRNLPADFKRKNSQIEMLCNMCVL